MSFHYTSFNDFGRYKILIFIFFIQCSLFGQDSFQKIEQDLRDIEQVAIEGILKHFTDIPNDECIATLKAIDELRRARRTYFFDEIDKSQIYHFQPKWNDNFKNYKGMTSTLWQDEEISLDTLSSYTKKCVKFRGINENLIDCAVPSETLLSGSAHIGSVDDLSTVFACVKSTIFCSKKEFIAPTIFFNVNRMQQVHKIFPIIEYTIHHEITHLIEAHAEIRDILMYLVAKYYAEEDLTRHDLFCKLEYAQELIADVAPAMVAMPNLFIKQYEDLANRLYIISSQSESNHPSLLELRVWHERILNCYERDYVKLDFYDKFSFALSIPVIRSCLIKYICMSGLLGVSFGAYLLQK